MRYSALAFAATIAGVSAQTAVQSLNLPQVTAASGSLSLGSVCSETEQCAGGAQCYGTTAYTIKTCGSFNAACDSDDQCATNTCSNGLCSGLLASSLYKVPSSTSAASSTSASTTAYPTATLPEVTAAAGSLSLGSVCSETDQCASDAQCYGTTAFTIKTCGSFNAACDSDDQCATNTCSNGLCSGFLASSLYKVPSSTASSTMVSTTAYPTATLPTVTAVAGSLSLGSVCSETEQCASGAQCWGTTSFTIKTCGSFNAACDSDAQCATNTCQNGLCSGVLASSLYKVPSSTAAAGMSASTGSAVSGGNGTVVAAGNGTVASATPSVYTGAAAKTGVEAAAALAFVALAFAL